jgi:hypothetical protein
MKKTLQLTTQASGSRFGEYTPHGRFFTEVGKISALRVKECKFRTIFDVQNKCKTYPWGDDLSCKFSSSFGIPFVRFFQIRSLQILETVNLMARGFPHRMRFKAFNARYRMLADPITRYVKSQGI